MKYADGCMDYLSILYLCKRGVEKALANSNGQYTLAGEMKRSVDTFNHTTGRLS